MPPLVSVFGSAKLPATAPVYAEARQLGSALARAGYTVMTGGYTGIMEAVSRGAAEAGGHVVGVTCALIEQWRGNRANAWVKEEIKFPTLRERLFYLVSASHGLVGLTGGIGTLSEVTLAWSWLQTGEMAAKPLVLVGRIWRETVTTFLREAAEYCYPADAQLLQLVDTPADVLPALQARLPGQ